MEKEYGELMSFLLQSRLHHGNETRFRAYVAESVRALAKDLRDFGLDVSVRPAVSEPVVAPVVAIREWNHLKVGCE